MSFCVFFKYKTWITKFTLFHFWSPWSSFTCLIEPKLIIQELWKRKVDWDEELHSDLKYWFQEWESQLRHIPCIFINRYYDINTHTETTELRFFVDSSNQVYGVAVYLRSNSNNDVKVSFVFGKSKLVPIKEKNLTIPKLGLQAALIVVWIKEKLIKEANVQVSKLHFWSDSKKVLKFIRNENTRFPTSVMHCINEIRSSSDISDWHFLRGNLNISDNCTHSTTFENIAMDNRYLNGPPFLYKSLQSVTRSRRKKRIKLKTIKWISTSQLK